MYNCQIHRRFSRAKFAAIDSNQHWIIVCSMLKVLLACSAKVQVPQPPSLTSLAPPAVQQFRVELTLTQLVVVQPPITRTPIPCLSRWTTPERIGLAGPRNSNLVIFSAEILCLLAKPLEEGRIVGHIHGRLVNAGVLSQEWFQCLQVWLVF